MTVWRDSTCYSRGERGTVEPRSWDLGGKTIRITVHRMHLVPDTWFLSCYDLNMSRIQLATKTADEAKAEGLARVKVRLQAMLAEVVS